MGSRLTFSAYRKIDAINWSRLKLLRISALAYRYAEDHPDDEQDTDAMRLGRATHTAVFEPDRFPLEYVVWTGDRRAGKAWEAFCAAAGDRTILTEAQYTRALGIRDAVRNHPLAAPYLVCGEAEKTLTWTDTATGLPCKARLDWLCGCVVDLKTTRSIDRVAMERTTYRLGYHCALAHYVAGAVANDLLVAPGRAVIIWVEQEPPHDVAVTVLTPDTLTNGAEEVARLLELLKTCTETNHWPGKYEATQDLELPFWAFDDEEEDPESMGFTRRGDTA